MNTVDLLLTLVDLFPRLIDLKKRLIIVVFRWTLLPLSDRSASTLLNSALIFYPTIKSLVSLFSWPYDDVFIELISDLLIIVVFQLVYCNIECLADTHAFFE